MERSCINELEEESDDGDIDYGELIEQHHLTVVKNLDLNRQFIFSYLRSKGVIDEEDCEMVMNSGTTRQQKVSRFLDILKRKGENGMKIFIEALEFEDPELYKTFTGKEASAVMAPSEKFGSIFADQDSKFVAVQLEQTVRNHHQMTVLVKQLQNDKTLLKNKLDESNLKNEFLQEYISSLKHELEVDLKKVSEELNQSNHDALFQTHRKLQQEFMNKMNLVIALQAKLLAQKEEIDTLKSENFELKNKSKTWKQSVYDLTLQCDNERRQSRRLHEKASHSLSTDPGNCTKIERQLKLEIATLKEDNGVLQEEVDEFRKFSELLNTKFNLVIQEKSEVHEQHEDLSSKYNALVEKLEALCLKYACLQCDNEYLRKANIRHVEDYQANRKIQKDLNKKIDIMRNEIEELTKVKKEKDESIHSQRVLIENVQENYSKLKEEIDDLQQCLMNTKVELAQSKVNAKQQRFAKHDITEKSSQSNDDTDLDEGVPDKSEDNKEDKVMPEYSKIRRSNKDLLASIKRKFEHNDEQISDNTYCQSPLYRGQMSYEQLQLLFPSDSNIDLNESFCSVSDPRWRISPQSSTESDAEVKSYMKFQKHKSSLQNESFHSRLTRQERISLGQICFDKNIKSSSNANLMRPILGSSISSHEDTFFDLVTTPDNQPTRPKSAEPDIKINQVDGGGNGNYSQDRLSHINHKVNLKSRHSFSTDTTLTPPVGKTRTETAV